MSKWTPGPWGTLADDGFTVIGYMPTEPDGEPSMVVISDASASLPDDTARANARLIAAAPEMATMIEQLLVKGSRWHPCDPLVVEARALLARINGESQ
jgi:hypothetical protein